MINPINKNWKISEDIILFLRLSFILPMPLKSFWSSSFFLLFLLFKNSSKELMPQIAWFIINLIELNINHHSAPSFRKKCIKSWTHNRLSNIHPITLGKANILQVQLINYLKSKLVHHMTRSLRKSRHRLIIAPHLYAKVSQCLSFYTAINKLQATST